MRSENFAIHFSVNFVTLKLIQNLTAIFAAQVSTPQLHLAVNSGMPV